MDLASLKTVLLIEDHPATRHLIEVVLERFEMHLVFASDGLSGLEAIEAHEPDLVLLDLLLPDINGWKVLERIRARRSAAELPVLIITAYDSDEAKALDLGANGHLPKPFEPSILRHAVAELLGGCLTS